MKRWAALALCLVASPLWAGRQRVIMEPQLPPSQTQAGMSPNQSRTLTQAGQPDPATLAKMQEAIQQQQMAYWANRQAVIARIIAAERARPKEDPAKVDKRVVEFLQDRISHGSLDARYDMAKRYLTGRGVDQDDAKARLLLKEAADQGHADSIKLLAELNNPPAEPAAPPKPAATDAAATATPGLQTNP